MLKRKIGKRGIISNVWGEGVPNFRYDGHGGGSYSEGDMWENSKGNGMYLIATGRWGREAPQKRKQPKKDYGRHALEALRRPVRKRRQWGGKESLNNEHVIKSFEGHSKAFLFYCRYDWEATQCANLSVMILRILTGSRCLCWWTGRSWWRKGGQQQKQEDRKLQKRGYSEQGGRSGDGKSSHSEYILKEELTVSMKCRLWKRESQR